MRYNNINNNKQLPLINPGHIITAIVMSASNFRTLIDHAVGRVDDANDTVALVVWASVGRVIVFDVVAGSIVATPWSSHIDNRAVVVDAVRIVAIVAIIDVVDIAVAVVVVCGKSFVVVSIGIATSKFRFQWKRIFNVCVCYKQAPYTTVIQLREKYAL